MQNWKRIVIGPQMSLGDTVRLIHATGLQIALVVDSDNRLLGTVTDGDIRRTIIRGLGMESPISKTMNPNPGTLPVDTPTEEILAFMRRNTFHHVPLIDKEGRLADVQIIDELIGAVERPNTVVVMAGGPGTRLRPLTDDCPKPLLPVGGKPILERILERFVEQGFRHFSFAVNYKAEMIVNHFGTGERWGVTIEYLHEKERLGTAGALSLLTEKPKHPLIVINGDLITEANFIAMLREHERHSAVATMAVREYEIQIPYGVIKLDGVRILSMEEKPLHRFLVNAGVYILSPEALDAVPRDVYFDMPSLFETLKREGTTIAYPLHEYWVDIGRHEELEKAHSVILTANALGPSRSSRQ